MQFGHKKGEGKAKMTNCISLKGTKLITKGGRGGRSLEIQGAAHRMAIQSPS